MKKINFEDGRLVTSGYVEIDGVQHNITEAVYEGETPLSSFNLNKMQDNIEEAIVDTTATQEADGLMSKEDKVKLDELIIQEEETASTSNVYSAEAMDNKINEIKSNDTGWVDLVLNENWVNVGAGYQTAQYRKINNQVFLRGIIKNDVDSGTVEPVTLPVELRPKASDYFPSNHADQFMSMFTESDGSLFFVNYKTGFWASINMSYFID